MNRLNVGLNDVGIVRIELAPSEIGAKKKESVAATGRITINWIAL